MAVEGALLKATREGKNLSLETVHEATKIPMDVLRAIEEGYTVRTLTPFYLRGFVKMYAEYLGVNPADVMREDKKKKESIRPLAQPKEAELDLEQWINNIFTSERKQQIAILVGIFVILFCLFKTITFFSHRRSRPVAKAKHGKIEPQKEDIVALGDIRVNQMAEKKKAQASATTAREVPPQAVYTVSEPASAAGVQEPVRKNVTLTVRTRRDSWLRVKSDGDVVFQSTLMRGAVETWAANDKIEISGKNINQLEFELNGKVIGTLGRRDAEEIVFTKDGLSVVR